MDVVDLTAAAAAALVLAVLAVSLVLWRRRRRPVGTSHGAVWTAASPPAWLIAASAATPEAAHPAPADEPEPAAAAQDPEPVTAAQEPEEAATALGPDVAGPCDWELHLATGGEVVVLRRARHRPCCVHTLSLAWLDAPPGVERTGEGLTWSGEHTHADPGGVSSDTRRDRTTAHAAPRGPGVDVGTRITREPGPEVRTPWLAATDTSAPAGRPSGNERLWTAHTDTLRRRGIRPRPDDATVVSTVDVVDRLQVRVDIARGCTTGGHRVAARVRTGVEVTGTVRGASRAACHVPVVAAWASGDLRAAATTATETSPGTTVLPLASGTVTPAPEASSTAMAVRGDPVHAAVAAALVGDDTTTTHDNTFRTTLGAMALLELSLGAADRSSAEAHLGVVLHHRLTVAVTPEPTDGPERAHPCLCRPTWALHLGDEVRPGPSSSPLGRLLVDDAAFILHRATGVGPPGAAWVVPTSP